MENLNELILSDHRIMMGKPVLKGTRITVESILRKMAEGADNEAIKAMYPAVKNEHIFAVLEYAANVISNEELIEVH